MNSPLFSDPLRSDLTRPRIPPPSIGGGISKPVPNILDALQAPQQRSVFISYHHGKPSEPGDQLYYNQLTQVGSKEFRLFRDNSLRDRIDSSNPEYVIQQIRDKYIKGSSCTVVLCGAKTHERKYVDWEIKATLDKEHGLVAVYLPSALRTPTGITVPDRLVPNIRSDYARWISWEDFTSSAANFKATIEAAVRRSDDANMKKLIYNPKEIKKYDG